MSTPHVPVMSTTATTFSFCSAEPFITMESLGKKNLIMNASNFGANVSRKLCQTQEEKSCRKKQNRATHSLFSIN